MILDSQNQFKNDFVAKLPHATSAAELMQFVEKSDMPPGYKDRFSTWVAQKGDMVVRLSDEERTSDFANFMGQSVKRELNVLIQGNSEKSRKLRQLAVRGQIVLVSRNGGVTFEEYLTVEEAQKADPLKYMFLSPTLRSTTTDIQEILDEQALLSVKKNLVDQNFLVKKGRVENHKVVIDAVSPKNVSYTIEVDTTEATFKPFRYTFINEDGKKRTVSEGQLPESYGDLTFDEGLDKLTAEEQELKKLVEDEAFVMGAAGAAFVKGPNLEAAAIAGAALADASLGDTAFAPRQLSANQLAAESGELSPATANMQLPTIMASKARLKRQQEAQDAAQNREEKRYIDAVEDARKQRAEAIADSESTQTAKGGGGGFSTIAKGLLGGGAVVGTSGLFAGLPIFLSFITRLN